METFKFDNIQSSKNVPLAERAAELISQLIIDRDLKAEDKLPNEFELADALNVGRGTIREAVKLLVARNVLEIRRGKGTYVAHQVGQIDDPLGLAYVPDQLQLAKDLLEIRLHVEPWIAALAAQRATDEDIAEIERICQEVEELIEQKENHLERDQELHVSIARSTHNAIMPRLVPVITYSVQLFGAVSGNTLRQETIDTHRDILHAIRNHDAAAAERAMYDHLQRNKDHILKLEKEAQSHSE